MTYKWYISLKVIYNKIKTEIYVPAGAVVEVSASSAIGDVTTHARTLPLVPNLPQIQSHLLLLLMWAKFPLNYII